MFRLILILIASILFVSCNDTLSNKARDINRKTFIESINIESAKVTLNPIFSTYSSRKIESGYFGIVLLDFYGYYKTKNH